MKNYFDFIIYLAFQASLRYENKRSLTIEQLHSYRLKLCQKHIEYHSQFSEYKEKEFEERLRSFHKLNQEMTTVIENKCFQNFMHDNDTFFSYDNGTISLKESIPSRELEEQKTELPSYEDWCDKLICGELISFYDDIDLLNILGAETIKHAVCELAENEKEVEVAYLKYDGDELQEKIQKQNAHLNFRLSLIGNMTVTKLNCYHRTILNISNLDAEYEQNGATLIEESLKDASKIYKPFYIEDILNYQFQRAIFGTGTLSYDRLIDSLNALWDYKEPEAFLEFEPIKDDYDPDEDEFDEDEDDFEENEFEEDDFEEEDEEYNAEVPDGTNQIELYLYEKKVKLLFYLNYIRHINEYQKSVGFDKNLDTSKRRLLYVLDTYGEDLYKEENFIRVLESISEEPFKSIKHFEEQCEISKLFLLDILKGNMDETHTIRKILFISTYYDLTNDFSIKEIIDGHNNTAIGRIIAKAILEHDYSGLPKFFTENVKKHILTE